MKCTASNEMILVVVVVAVASSLDENDGSLNTDCYILYFIWFIRSFVHGGGRSIPSMVEWRTLVRFWLSYWY